MRNCLRLPCCCAAGLEAMAAEEEVHPGGSCEVDQLSHPGGSCEVDQLSQPGVSHEVDHLSQPEISCEVDQLSHPGVSCEGDQMSHAGATCEVDQLSHVGVTCQVDQLSSFTEEVDEDGEPQEEAGDISEQVQIKVEDAFAIEVRQTMHSVVTVQ